MPLQASTPAIHTQGSLRGGVPPLNGGVGGQTPQIRVLSSLRESKLIKFLSFADTLLPAAIEIDPIFNKKL